MQLLYARCKEESLDAGDERSCGVRAESRSKDWARSKAVNLRLLDTVDPRSTLCSESCLRATNLFALGYCGWMEGFEEVSGWMHERMGVRPTKPIRLTAHRLVTRAINRRDLDRWHLTERGCSKQQFCFLAEGLQVGTPKTTRADSCRLKAVN